MAECLPVGLKSPLASRRSEAVECLAGLRKYLERLGARLRILAVFENEGE